MSVSIGDKIVSRDSAVFVTAEIGINHNGDINLAKRLIDVAVEANCDAVKFQKRNPDVCVPESQKMKKRDTPWGYIPYIDYKHKIELGKEEYDTIDKYCRKKGILWFASCWDPDSIDFISQYDVSAFKIASASITDTGLLEKIKRTGKSVIMSAGMSTLEEVDNAVEYFDADGLILCHTVSSYPTKSEDLNLNVIRTFLDRYPNIVIGYSGHEVGLPTTYVAVGLGAAYIERHITLDRTMWGTDHAVSIEPHGLQALVQKIKTIKKSLGNGVKEVYPSEIPIREKLRNCK